MSFFGNADGRLHVQCQVEDYVLRGREFEDMGFLTFTVETYERRIQEEKKDEKDDFYAQSIQNHGGTYLSIHSKATTHYRVSRTQNHNALPNIVGPWLPRRDGDASTKSYYYAAMLSFLKPWRELHDIKRVAEAWEGAFESYMKVAGQRDRDVVAGCQYYYESKNIAANRDDDEDGSDERDDNVGDEEGVVVEDDPQSDITSTSVRILFKVFIRFGFTISYYFI
jgi:hypothetical protein